MGSASGDPFLESGAVSQEILGNVKTVLAFPHLITTKTQRFVDAINVGLPIAQKRAVGNGLITGLNLGIMQGVIYGVGMYAGIRFAEKGWVTFEDVFGSFMGVIMMGMGLGQIGSVIPALKAANISANKFYAAKQREAKMRKADANVAPLNGAQPLSG